MDALPFDQVDAKIDTLTVALPERQHPHNFRNLVEAIDPSCGVSFQGKAVFIQDPGSRMLRGLTELGDGRGPEVIQIDVAVDFRQKQGNAETYNALAPEIIKHYDKPEPLRHCEWKPFRDHQDSWYLGRWRKFASARDVKPSVALYVKTRDRKRFLTDGEMRLRLEVRLSPSVIGFSLQAPNLRKARSWFRFSDGQIDRKVKIALDNGTRKLAS
jgi:hypothetical protein